MNAHLGVRVTKLEIELSVKVTILQNFLYLRHLFKALSEFRCASFDAVYIMGKKFLDFSDTEKKTFCMK